MRLPRVKEKYDWRNLDPIIKAELNKGVPIKDISKIIGLPYTTVYNHIVANNFHRSRKYSDHINPVRIIRLYKEGVKQKQIAEEFGCSISTITRTVRKAGITRRNYNLAMDDILSLLEQGFTYEQTSEKCGKSINYMYWRRGYDPEFKRLTDEARAFGKSLNKELAG